MIITIDGPAGSGKSTVAERLANRLKFIHFNSGSLYRGITAHLLTNNVDFSTLGDFDCSRLRLDTKMVKGIQHVYVNKIDYTPMLRDNEISINVPVVSNIQAIRNIIDACQRKFARRHNIVIDGRDTGSFVFPNADFKFYLDCSLDERARRRFNEEKTKNPSTKLKDIKAQIHARDEFDKNKDIARLVVPVGAKIIDSTKMTIDEVVDEMLNLINTARG